jgi:hypothetical protein
MNRQADPFGKRAIQHDLPPRHRIRVSQLPILSYQKSVEDAEVSPVSASTIGTFAVVWVEPGHDSAGVAVMGECQRAEGERMRAMKRGQL